MRSRLHRVLIGAALAASVLSSRLLAQNVAGNDVVWTTLGSNENDSMPIGNGDLAANVWTEGNGDIVLLLAKSDAWNEVSKLLKPGRVRIKLTPNPFAGAAGFQQTLHVQSGTIELKAGENVLRVWADANHPALHVEGHLAQGVAVQASAEFWRKIEPFAEGPMAATDPEVLAGSAQPVAAADILFPAAEGRLAWCHFNFGTIYPYSLRQEHIEGSIGKYPDPLLHRASGVALAGAGMAAADDRTLRSSASVQDVNIMVVSLTQKSCESPKAWLAGMDGILAQAKAGDLAAARSAHERWWSDFWDRSWIRCAGGDHSEDVSQGYAIQRYMMACSSRGEQPPKHNGGLFTVGHDVPVGTKQTKDVHDPDYRLWGDYYWNQNNRLLYWPLIASGDLDLLRPWFNVYLNALLLATDRAHTYYHHAGAFFPETYYFWGLNNVSEWKNNPGFESSNRYMRYHFQGSLEVLAQMLEAYDSTQDAEFARKGLVPFAEAIVHFYDEHYPRNAAKKITFVPAQALESYQLTVANPTPDIAALMNVLPRLLALPADVTTEGQRAVWARLLKELPPIPVGTTAQGKLPPMGRGDPDGTPTILPAEQYGAPTNTENPELYAVFPYRVYGVGKPELKLAQDTFAVRRIPQDTCWGTDGPEAAVLGLTAVAQKAAVDYFTNYGDERFPWFWKAAHDWIPDLDNGGNGMITLQLMLMQCDGRRIQLLPAWPKEWTADFKLHAPFNTTVEGHVEGGKVTGWKVMPEERAKDVVVLPVQ